MIEKEKTAMEDSSLDARNSIAARTRVITPFIEIIAGMDANGEGKACMRTLLYVLPCGNDNPILSADITKQTGINTSAVKKAVRNMRIAGIPIASCTRGYYLCVTDAEKAKFRRYMTKKIITAAKVLDGFQCSEDGQ